MKVNERKIIIRYQETEFYCRKKTETPIMTILEYIKFDDFIKTETNHPIPLYRNYCVTYCHDNKKSDSIWGTSGKSFKQL